MLKITTWRTLITEEMADHGENWDDVAHVTKGEPDPEFGLVDFDLEFENFTSPFAAEQKFTIWTAQRVYFPAANDQIVWCASVPRNPCEEAVERVGE